MTKDSMISKSSKNVFRIFGGSPSQSEAIQKTVLSNSKIMSPTTVMMNAQKKPSKASFSTILYQKNVLKQQMSNINNTEDQMQKENLINTSTTTNNKNNQEIRENAAQPVGLSHLLNHESKFNIDISHIININSQYDDRVDNKLRKDALIDLLSIHQAFYNMNTVTFAKSICLVDTFMNKIKFKPKYIKCVSAACYYIASKFEKSMDAFYPTRDNLIRIYRCPGTKEDLTRMIDIILNKLSPEFIASIGANNSTAYNFLELFHSHVTKSSSTSTTTETSYNPTLKSLSRKLELMLCYSTMTKYRPACQALAILYGSCLDDNHSTVKFLDKIDDLTLLDVLNLAYASQVDWVDIEECYNAFLPILNSNHLQREEHHSNQFFPDTNNMVMETSSTNHSGSPPIRWSLSKRTRISMNKFASVRPKLEAITEDNCEEESFRRYQEETNMKNSIIINKHTVVTPLSELEKPELPKVLSHPNNNHEAMQSSPEIITNKPKNNNNTNNTQPKRSSSKMLNTSRVHKTSQIVMATASLVTITAGHHQFNPFNSSSFPTNYNQFYDDINDSICGLLTPLLIA